MRRWLSSALLVVALLAASVGGAAAATRFLVSFGTDFHTDAVSGGTVGSFTIVKFIADSDRVFYELTPYVESLKFTKGKMTTFGTRECRSTKGSDANFRYSKYELCLTVIKENETQFKIISEEHSESSQAPSYSEQTVRTQTVTFRVTRLSNVKCTVGLLGASYSYDRTTPKSSRDLHFKVKGGRISDPGCSLYPGDIMQ